MQDIVDLHRGDRGTLQRGHQHAAQRVAERQAKATFQRFGHDGRLTGGIVAGVHHQLRGLDQLLPILMDHVSPPFLFRAL